MSYLSGPLDPHGEPSSRPGRIPHPVHASRPDGGAPWIVTLAVRHPDGRQGTHSFVEWAASHSQAVAAALLRARTSSARDHRRGAPLDGPHTARAELWRGSALSW
ncbi:hypothetical protein [Kitasatospora camelliae]|uniref:Uncharacterized protein n=1 Tax=Kitasatospora camelliae TaxID=3156397 RepID=A0AAU8K5V6_9ACTN